MGWGIETFDSDRKSDCAKNKHEGQQTYPDGDVIRCKNCKGVVSKREQDMWRGLKPGF